jgi:uncharacterized protein YutE (UPF0331/DUF86 family)
MLSNTDRSQIIKRIDFIQTEIQDLLEFDKINFNQYSMDRKVQRNIERIAENVANAIIDVSKILLSSKNVVIPDSYRESVLKLGEFNIVDLKIVENMAEIARLRNVLAHYYLDIKWDYLNKFLTKDVTYIQEFLESVKKYIH